ncbi:MAG: hypothetical protein CME62_13250 [Halobacteriovoraceae bacterium]|nr:hypothetical protein [Halobacteriovoraceae bacterium]|tara:strand:- start:5337 stop:6470 length:1134 start_codon:yes stop_codon:yes gene_type:complete
MNKIFIIILGWQISTLALAQAKSPTIKVRISDKNSVVEISGVDLEKKIHITQKAISYPGHKKIRFNCKSNKNLRNQRPIKIASFNSPAQTLNFGKDKFKGLIHIQTSENYNGCDVINETALDDYLSTLLAKEMESSWPIEALKAQAVAARSYALYKIKSNQVSKNKGFNTNYDLENSEYHQVNGTFFDATTETNTAANSTAGEVLANSSGQLVPVFFHSKCGGKTRLPEQVWSNSVEGYQTVNCPFCHEHGKKNWTIKLPKRKLISTLGKLAGVNANRTDIRVLDDHLKSSQVKMYVNDNLTVIKKSKLRSLLGRKYLPSNYFIMAKSKDSYTVIGSGYGHGVGMCQFGAKELALQGYSYKQILAHYFPQLKIKKVY